MKICANCGNQVEDNASFCNNCGSPLVTAESSPAQNTPVQNTPVQNTAAQNTPVQNASAQNTPAPGAPEQNSASANQEPKAPVQETQAQPQINATPVAPVPAPMQQNYQNNQGGPTTYQQGMYTGQPQPGYQPYQQFDPHDHTAEFDAKDIADNKLFAVLPYFFTCFAGILAGIYVKESEFLKFHTKNAIRLNIVALLIGLFTAIPFVGWICGPICGIVFVVVKIIGIVNVFQGKAKDLPVISTIGFLK